MITDLDDQSDNRPMQPHRTNRKRQAFKTLHTISGNFNSRSRSVDCQLSERSEDKLSKTARINSHFNELLQSKDKQMEKLLQRLSLLHKFNEQFSQENRTLHEDVSALNEQISQLRQKISNCENCRKLSQQLTKSVEQNKADQANVEMMKTLVYRLNVQIENYQDELRHKSECDGGGESPKQQFKSVISQWTSDVSIRTHTLTPLLQAYDEMIRDKEELIQQYRQQFEHFTGELKHVLEENTRLLRLNENLKRDVGNWREERTCLVAQLDVCRSKAETQTRKSDIAKEKLVEVMHCYEQKMQTLVLDMEHLQSAYARCKTELAALRSVTAQPQDAISQSLLECKELLEQLKQQHTKEKHSLERKIGELSERNLNSERKIEQLKQENAKQKKELQLQIESNEELRDTIASLQRATEKVKHSRDRLRSRLRIALQWAQKLEKGQENLQNTWDALKRLETIVKHKESQVRGLQTRHVQEIDQLQKKLAQKDETIRTILRGKIEPNNRK